MKRSSKYTLKFLTKRKKERLNQMLNIYEQYLQKTIDLMWNKKIPLVKNLSSKNIDWMDNLGGQYKNLIYKQASEIVRGCKLRKGNRVKPVVKKLTISFDKRMINIENSKTTEFNKWIRLKLPFITEKKNKVNGKMIREELLIPLKEHRHSLKFIDWKLSNVVKLNKNFIELVFNNPDLELKTEGRVIGIDQGYKNLLTTSDNKYIGKDFNKIYEKIARKKQYSKAFWKLLIHRNNEINRLINSELDLRDIKEVVIEELKDIKRGTKGKFNKKFNNKLQRWVCAKCTSKLERFLEENRVLLTKVNPAYTSQTCNLCGFRHKKNRKGEIFLCLNCGHTEHADTNAGKVLSQMGVYSPYPSYMIVAT